VQSYIKNVFFLIFALFLAVSAHAENSDKSLVAIAPDRELCLDSQGHFLPLPSLDSAEASFKFINSVIDEKFGNECKLNGFLLKGRITEETLPQLRLGLQLLEARRNERTIGANTLWLDSPGGLIAEAMKIGDIIAEKGMESIVLFRGRCYSSCVFIYAAAKTRSGIGDVGIHRPFASEISASSLSYAEYLEKYDDLTPIMKRYFSKYGVSPSLVDAMNVIPSDEIKILSDEERDAYGLGFNNIASKEHEKARTIQVCGREYYDLHLGFHALIGSCRKRFGISSLDDKDEECWALARQAYPDYSDKFDECKLKKPNHESKQTQ
jgi:hypothetical protein